MPAIVNLANSAICGIGLVLCVAPVTVMGCSIGPGGSFESLSGGSGGEDGQGEAADDESGFPPGAACEFEYGANPVGKTACNDAGDCCASPLVATSLAGAAGCPSNTFPNDWSCVEGECLNPGCTQDLDCRNLMANDAWICAEINDVGHCVVSCTDDPDCEAENLSHATCESIGGYSFCVQPQPT